MQWREREEEREKISVLLNVTLSKSDKQKYIISVVINVCKTLD